MSLPPTTPASSASGGSAGDWPQGFEARWRHSRQLLQQAAAVPLSTWLEDCRQDPQDWQLQWFLAQVCGAHPGGEAIATLEQLETLAREALVQVEILRAWCYQGEPGQRRLEAAIAHPLERAQALEALAGTEQPAFMPLLMAGARDPDPRWRAEAARALGQARDAHLLQSLLDLVGDPDAAVRRAVVEAVRLAPALDPDQRHGLLVAALADPDPEVAREAVWGLAHQGDWRAIAHAATQAGPVRPAALVALGSAGEAIALEHLAGLPPQDWSEAEWRSVIQALGGNALAAEATRLLLGWWPRQQQRPDLIYALGRLGQAEQVCPVLAELLPQTPPGSSERLALEQARRALEC